ncbi:MAG: hypothetical protein ACREIF_06105 [Chthoniobacterales bacterium]
MKKIILSILLATATSVAFGQGQGELTTTTATTTAKGHVETKQPKPRSPQAVPLVPTTGVIQVAIKNRNAVQMINPAAPARYGNGQEHAMHDSKDPGKPKGIVLLGWTF